MTAPHPSLPRHPAEEPLLGVRASALGRIWRMRLDGEGQRQALAIAQVHGLPDVLARVLAGRGVTAASAPLYLEPRLRDLLPDPDLLVDMPAAVERIARAILLRRRIAIFGDYDVDGACSAAILAQFFEHFGVPTAVHIPDRITEGYGPNPAALRALAAEGAALLICADCGTTGHEALKVAKDQGLDVVVLDHHQADPVLPAVDALVNPNRQDDLSGLGHLCAAGVVFLTLVGVARALRAQGKSVPDLMQALDLVALATVADVVPLTGLNRAFVRQGLKVLAGRGRPGLAALADVAGLADRPQAWHLGYLLGPRINAGGRIGDSSMGARLLRTRDRGEAQTLAVELDRLNRERQTVESAMVSEAEAQALSLVGVQEEGAPVLVVAGEGWHPGIVGIVAGRLKERFDRPALALAIEGESAVASGRSIAGVDLGRAIRGALAAGLLVKGGGHAMAAGATLRAVNIPALRAFLIDELGAAVAVARTARALLIDAALTAPSVTPDLVEALENAGPFGQANPEPLIVLPAHRISDVAVVGTDHLRVTLESEAGRLSAMAFRAVGKPLGDALQRARGEIRHVAGHVALDLWGGRKRAQLRIVDLATPTRSIG